MNTQANATVVLLMALLDGKGGLISEDPYERIKREGYTKAYGGGDPYKALKEAVAAGKNVQIQIAPGGGWYDCVNSYCGWSLPVECYRIDPYDELKKAYADKLEIEVLSNSGNWIKLVNPLWNAPIERYRVHDPYRELKEAHAAGKEIQFEIGEDEWLDCVVYPEWRKGIRYRVSRRL